MTVWDLWFSPPVLTGGHGIPSWVGSTDLGTYEIDFRTRDGPGVRWISARGQGNDADILAREMSHRVKNLLAIANGLTRLTSRYSTSIEDMVKQLTTRLTALGRAHDLVRPVAGSTGNAALLGDVFAVLLAPYDDRSASAERIRIAVPRMAIGEATATSLALVVHEFATNSVKYGALSTVDGLRFGDL